MPGTGLSTKDTLANGAGTLPLGAHRPEEDAQKTAESGLSAGIAAQPCRVRERGIGQGQSRWGQGPGRNSDLEH